MSTLTGPQATPQQISNDVANDVLDRVLEHFDERSQSAATLNYMHRYATQSYLKAFSPETAPPPAVVEAQLLALTNAVIRSENLKIDKSDGRHALLKALTNWQLAQVLVSLHRVIRAVFPAGNGVSTPAVYCDEGPCRGTYVVDEVVIHELLLGYHTGSTLRTLQEVMQLLNTIAAKVPVCSDPNLIAVNNGIFDYATKQLHPFDPDCVFLAKIRVDYVETATNPQLPTALGQLWDVESWLEDLFEDPQLLDLAWKTLGAVIRPNVPWHKAVLLYNQKGNNGKGTFYRLAKNLVGEESWATLSIADCEHKFRLPVIVGKTAFGHDENDVGSFTEKNANFKALITGDDVTIERKGKDPFGYQPRGLMIQCMNGDPKGKDVSPSFYRRLLFFPFLKCFTGNEDKAIKFDYLGRQEVLQYVLKRVLMMPDFYELPEPDASKMLLADFMLSNDPVREFWDEFEPKFAWDLLPQAFLHDLFTAWCKRVNPRGGSLKRREFYDRLKLIVAESDEWEDGQFATRQHMTLPEYLIFEYTLEAWMSPGTYASYRRSDTTDIYSLCHPVTAAKYRGLRRTQPALARRTTSVSTQSASMQGRDQD